VHSHNLLITPPGETDAWAINLPSDAPLLIAGYKGWDLTVRYQPRYPPAVSAQSGDTFVSLDRHTRIPDLAIEATRPGHPPRIIVLDAKYRLDADERAVPADALAEAYAYAGAIGAADPPSVVAALILYPGTGAAERYPGGAGAIPLLPGAVDALDAALTRELG
jgi:large subunit ribosomal protein MRP49